MTLWIALAGLLAVALLATLLVRGASRSSGAPQPTSPYTDPRYRSFH